MIGVHEGEGVMTRAQANDALMERAREFYAKRFPRFPTNDDYVFEVLAAFAAEILKAERERLFEALRRIETEFAREI
jgi:hypothetical protein